jgi:hypothetical protein
MIRHFNEYGRVGGGFWAQILAGRRRIVEFPPSSVFGLAGRGRVADADAIVSRLI